MANDSMLISCTHTHETEGGSFSGGAEKLLKGEANTESNEEGKNN